VSSEECSHCGASFDDEETYLRHLLDEHADDLGPIEQRRVATLGSDDEGPDAVVYAAAIGALVLVGLLAYVLFPLGDGAAGTGASDGGSDGGEPHDLWSVHYHGTITVTIGGQELDFSRREFQMQADPFHFENRDGEQWHVHAKGVTLSYAMETLGINVTANTVTYDGTTYGDDSSETVVVEVNGEPVGPDEYVLQEGDHVRIVANGSSE
jgi:sulfur carrier protein ThiS